MLIEQLNVATPLDALSGLEAQVKVPVPGLVPMARATGADDEVTTLPNESSTDRATVKFVPAVELAGGVEVVTSWLGEPALMVSTWVPLVSAPEAVMVGEPALVSP